MALLACTPSPLMMMGGRPRPLRKCWLAWQYNTNWLTVVLTNVLLHTTLCCICWRCQLLTSLLVVFRTHTLINFQLTKSNINNYSLLVLLFLSNNPKFFFKLVFHCKQHSKHMWIASLKVTSYHTQELFSYHKNHFILTNITCLHAADLSLELTSSL